MQDEPRRTTASCRLSREERAAVELATARSDLRFASEWMRRAVLDRLEQELGPDVTRAPRRVGGEVNGAT